MSVFGLDIGTTSIKAIQLEPAGQGFTLVGAGIAQSPKPGISSEAERDLEAVAQMIKKLVSDTGITTREVNMSLPESQVFTRLISLPLLTDQEVASAILWQAEPYIPIPTEQASLDYQIVSRRGPQGTDSGGVEVLLVAAPKLLVNKYSKIASLAGLNVASLETELLALSRAIAPQDRTVLIADIGSTSTDLGIVRRGQLVVTRSINTAGNVLTRAVSSGLSLDAGRAEEYKKSYGLNQQALQGKVKSVLEPIFTLISEEVKKTIQYYKTDVDRNDQVSLVITSGGTAGMADLAAYISGKLGLQVAGGNPFYKVAQDERTAKLLARFAPLYGIAVGLAENV